MWERGLGAGSNYGYSIKNLLTTVIPGGDVHSRLWIILLRLENNRGGSSHMGLELHKLFLWKAVLAWVNLTLDG